MPKNSKEPAGTKIKISDGKDLAKYSMKLYEKDS